MCLEPRERGGRGGQLGDAGHGQMQESLAGSREESGFCRGRSGQPLEGVENEGNIPESSFTKMTGHRVNR